jgi:hypothetical protein
MNQQQLINAGRQLDLARIPIWSGVKDAVFTPEQWIDRIEKAKGNNAGNWTNDTTMSYVYNALRGDALIWFEALPTLGYDNTAWDDFKAAFLRTYGTTRTARTAALNLAEVRQGGSEPAARYITRVIKIVADIRALAPANLPVPNNPYEDDIRGLVGWGALDNAIKQRNIQTLMQAGAQDAYNRLGMQLFIAGLRPNIRVELMKANPGTIREAFDAALDAEKILAEPRRDKASHILAVASNEDPSDANSEASDAEEEETAEADEEEASINALTAKMKKLKKKIEAKKNKQGKNAAKTNGQNGKRSASKSQSERKSGACRFCNKEGHYQAECYARKAAGAPMVDARGKPFSSGGGVHALETPYRGQHGNTPFAQQQFNPFAHYAQNEQVGGGGGVGAIWSNHWQQPQGAQMVNNDHLNY